MSRNADESEKDVPGTEIVVDCRWLLHRKKATKKVKARIIAPATATSVGARTLIALLAEKNKNGEDWIAVFGDVKTAFLHA
eukprot:1965319-Heterocapsa_arctica.AAC.1